MPVLHAFDILKSAEYRPSPKSWLTSGELQSSACQLVAEFNLKSVNTVDQGSNATMFAKPRLLILATFALLSTLAVTSLLAAPLGAPIQQLLRSLPQDPNTVNIQTGRGLVIVVVEKTPVRVGELVRFTLSPASLVNNPKLNVSVDFGDGTFVRARQPVVTHRYRATGHYKVNASVVLTQRDQGDDPPRVVPRVSLVATPNPVSAGNRVSFTAQLASNYPGIKYRFTFGDGSQTDWQDAPYASHPYAPGGTYLAYVDLGLGIRGAIRQVGGSIRQPIVVTDFQKPTPDPSPSISDDRASVQLTANPTPVQIGSPVVFSGRVTSGPANVRYRFFFGDGSPSTGWQTDSQASHTYTAAGDYPARVEIGRWSNGRVTPTATSNTKVISVTSQIVPSASPTPTPDGPPGSPTPTPPGGPTPLPGATGSPDVIAGPVSPDHKIPPLDTVPNNWWVYLLILLLLGFVGYQLYRSVLVPRASFHPNLDMGSSEVDATATTKGLSITSQVLMRPNLSEGQYVVQTDEGNIVRSVRRENV